MGDGGVKRLWRLSWWGGVWIGDGEKVGEEMGWMWVMLGLKRGGGGVG